MPQVFKFRGCDNLYVAKVTADASTGITYDTPVQLAPLADVGKVTGSESASSYADNKALIIVNSEGNDEITMTVFGISLENLAMITGKTFNTAKGLYTDGVRNVDYFALGYREKLTNGEYRYIWRLKGTFAIPDEATATEDDGTESQTQTLTYTGIFTEAEFTEGGGSAKGVVVDTQYEGAYVTDFFTTVKTPDTASVRPTPPTPEP